MKLCIIKKASPEVDEAWHSAKEDMRNEHIKKYIEKHGYHFTDKLAEHASKFLVNRNKKDTHWTADNISSLVKSLGVSIPGNVTRGDICYSANMYYSDFYPDLLRGEGDCVNAAIAIAEDPDGYDGIIFRRWLSDYHTKVDMGLIKPINWEDYY